MGTIHYYPSERQTKVPIYLHVHFHLVRLPNGRIVFFLYPNSTDLFCLRTWEARLLTRTPDDNIILHILQVGQWMRNGQLVFLLHVNATNLVYLRAWKVCS